MSNWVQKDAAELLGISPRVMNYKIKTLAIDFPRGRTTAWSPQRRRCTPRSTREPGRISKDSPVSVSCQVIRWSFQLPSRTAALSCHRRPTPRRLC